MHRKISIHLVLTNCNKDKYTKSLFLNTLLCIHCLYIYIYIYIDMWSFMKKKLNVFSF